MRALVRRSTHEYALYRRLPVVDPDIRALLGVLRRTDLVRAYDVALTRRTTLPTAPGCRLDVSTTQVSLHEITVKTGARASVSVSARWAGRAIRYRQYAPWTAHAGAARRYDLAGR